MNSSQNAELVRFFEKAELEKQKMDLPADAVSEEVGFPKFPSRALIGPLKEIVEASPLPPQFMYLTLVTMFGNLVGPRLVCGTRSRLSSGRLFSVLLAPAGGQKGTTLNLCRALLAQEANIIRKGDGIGSGESLIGALHAEGGHACLFWEEMSAFFNKGHIDGSTLFGNAADLYYSTEVSARRAGSKGSAPSVVVHDAWLSLIGGLTKDAWESAWNKQMGTGLFRRFQIAAVEDAVRIPFIPDDELMELATPLRDALRNPRIPAMDGMAEVEWEVWSGGLPTGEAYVSLDENVKRVALILACMCCSDVSPEVMHAAIAWGDYQRRLREMLAPGSAENKEAACEQFMLKHLPKRGKVTWSWLYVKANLKRFGSGMSQRVRSHVVANGLMAYHKPHVWRPTENE